MVGVDLNVAEMDLGVKDLDTPREITYEQNMKSQRVLRDPK